MKPQVLLSLVAVVVLATVAWFVFLDRDAVAPAAPPTVASDEGDGARDVRPAGAPEAAAASSVGTGSGGEADVAVERADAALATRPRDGGEDPRVWLRGRFVDLAGAPRAGVAFTVHARQGFGGVPGYLELPGRPGVEQQVETGADGRFEFRIGSRDASWLRLVDAQELVFVEPARFEPSTGDRDVGDLVVAGAASIAGHVRNAAGQPLADVEVTVGSGALLGSSGKARTGTDGAFVLGGLRPGAWQVRTASSQFLPGSAEVDLAAEERRTGLELVLEPGRAIAGRVVDDRGFGVAGMKVTSLRRESRGGMSIERFSDKEAATTDARGEFLLRGLEQDHVTVRASGDGHTDASQANVATGTTDLELRVQRHGSITGVLITDDGLPIAGSRVRAEKAGPGPVIRGLVGIDLDGGDSARTDENGRFELTSVPPGTVRLRATGEQHRPASLDGLRVQPAQELSGLRLIAEAGATARVRVVDDEGRPVAGARVEVERRPDRPTGGPGVQMRSRAVFADEDSGEVRLDGRRVVGSGDSDDEGYATILGLPAGEMVVQASHAKFAPSDSTPVVLPVAGTVEAQVALFEPGYVDVTAHSADGEPASGAMVLLRREAVAGVEVVERGHSDSEGKLRFGPLRAGDYSLALGREPKAHSAGGMTLVLDGDDKVLESTSTPVTVIAGSSVAASVRLPVLTRLTGRVIGAEGPVANAVVRLANSEDDLAIAELGGMRATTDESGEYAFDGVEAGSYTVEFGKRDQVVMARDELDVAPNTPELTRDLFLRCGTVRVTAVASGDAKPVAGAEVVLERAAREGAPRERRVMMVSISTSDGAGEEASTMTFGRRRVQTDDQGVAVFEDVPVGNYVARIESDEHAPTSKSDIAVVERQVTDVGSVALKPAGHLRGDVVDAAGKSVGMALVQLRKVGEQEWDRTEVAMQGQYRLRGIEPGRYELRARRVGPDSGEASASVPVTVEIVAGETAVQQLAVPQ